MGGWVAGGRLRAARGHCRRCSPSRRRWRPRSLARPPSRPAHVRVQGHLVGLCSGGTAGRGGVGGAGACAILPSRCPRAPPSSHVFSSILWSACSWCSWRQRVKQAADSATMSTRLTVREAPPGGRRAGFLASMRARRGGQGGRWAEAKRKRRQRRSIPPPACRPPLAHLVESSSPSSSPRSSPRSHIPASSGARCQHRACMQTLSTTAPARPHASARSLGSSSGVSRGGSAAPAGAPSTATPWRSWMRWRDSSSN